jgi:hypothetical protein
MIGRRWPALVALLVVLGVLVGLDLRGHDDDPVRFGSAVADALPTADPAGALSTTWYCAAGTAVPGGTANLTVVIANTGPGRRTGTVTWMPTGAGERVTQAVTVEADAVVSAAAVDHLQAPAVSALVELDGGGVAVEHVVSGSRGSAVAPCASQASPRWYFANGVTERDARQVLALFNPFPDDAVVDLTFATDAGVAKPRDLQGYPIAAGTTAFVDVHGAVRRRAATSVAIVARTGRLVADRVQSFDGVLGRTGVGLAVGASATAETWVFPDGLSEAGVTERWHVLNPSRRDAEVSLELVPATGEAPEPLDFTVPAGGRYTVDAATSERVVAGVAHASTIRSLNGVGVVAERSLDVRAPAARRGWTSSFGAPRTARRWVFPVGEANGNTDEWVIVHNPGAGRVRVSVYALAGGQRLPIEALQDLALGAAGRVAVRLGDHIARSPLPLLVVATGEVVAERAAYAVRRAGVSSTIGIPLAR